MAGWVGEIKNKANLISAELKLELSLAINAIHFGGFTILHICYESHSIESIPLFPVYSSQGAPF